MQTPQYASFPAFVELSSLARRAGITIRFGDVPPHAYAQSRDNLIVLPQAMRFQSPEHAAIVLGHEIAHTVINRFYQGEGDNDGDLPRHMLMEADCDRLGTFLYLLADETVKTSARAVWDADTP